MSMFGRNPLAFQAELSAEAERRRADEVAARGRPQGPDARSARAGGTRKPNRTSKLFSRPAVMTMISVIIGLVGGIWHWLSKPLVEWDPCTALGACIGGEVASFVRGALGLDDVLYGVLVAIAAFLLLAAALYVRPRTHRTSPIQHSN